MTEKLPWGRLLLIMFAALAVFVAGGLWATYLLYKPTGSLTPGAQAPAMKARGQPEIGIVDHTPFALEKRSFDAAAGGRKRLSSYGWVDRANNRVHIPIDVAIQRIASEGRR